MQKFAKAEWLALTARDHQIIELSWTNVFSSDHQTR